MSEETAVAIRMQDLSPEYAEIMVLGKVLHASGYFKDVRDQAQAVTKILFGRELGFSPIIALGGIHIIEGKPALSSNLMATLIKRSGKYDYRVKTWTDNECVLTFREKNGAGWEDVGESSFTIEDAKRAGVVKPGGSWAKYPRAMTFARALSQGLRTYCPDVSAAPIYNPEEMGATVDEEGSVTELPKSARPVDVTTEDIEIKRGSGHVANNTGPAGSGTGKAEGSVGTSPTSSAPGQPTSDDIRRALLDSHRNQDSEPVGATLVKEPPSNTADTGNVAGSEPIQYIGIGQQRNIHKEFSAHVSPASSLKADDYFYQWLIDNGYVDDNKQPTAARIPASGWLTTKQKALAYAKTI